MIIACSNIIIIILEEMNDRVHRYITNSFIFAANVILEKKYIYFYR
jgi:hypothetical protein